jgi:hypothetical protein
MKAVLPAPGLTRATPVFPWYGALPAALIVLPLLAFAVGLNPPTSLVIFLLLIGLMLTGMPISIALGLTVLTYMYTMTTVPITAVALSGSRSWRSRSSSWPATSSRTAGWRGA